MSENEKICPIHSALNCVGDKWSLILIRDVMLFGKRYYKELLSSREGISTNILADRLVKLEHCGIFHKVRDQHCKNRFRYLLTHKGLDLMPVLMEMIYWGASYDKNSGVPAEFMQRYREDKHKLQEYLLSRYQQVNTEQEAARSKDALSC